MCGGIKQIIMLIFGAVIAMVMTACHHEEESVEDKTNNYRLSISVSTISSRASESPVEKIKSLRIIVMDSDTVELNTLVNLSDIVASGFIYNLIYYTTPGVKSFYIFGNEESVGNLSFSSSSNNTAYTDQNLTEILNTFQKGESKQQLQSLMEDIYFQPQYNPQSDGTIYLPYSAYYGEDYGLSVGERELGEANLYLVPVSTKFLFNFKNYRSTGVKVNNIILSSSNNQNYLFAHVGNSNIKMTSPYDSEKELYWIDWLAEVSFLSQEQNNSSQNQVFNDRYGWIWDYYLPIESETQDNIFVADSESFIISPAINQSVDGTENVNPSICTKGPFYVPESINNEPNSADDDRRPQQYYLTIDFEDVIEGKKAPSFENVTIPNLKALFRSTYVIINIDMKQGSGDIDIYAQIADWNYQSATGFVTENSNPPNLN